MLVYGTIDYVKHIKNPVLKVALMIVNIMAIVGLGYNSLATYTDEAPPKPEDPPPKPEDISFMDSVRKDLDSASNIVKNVYGEVPDFSKIKENIQSKLPDVNTVIKNMKDAKETIQTNISEIKQNIPSISEIKENIPSISEIKENIPSISEIKENIPYVKGIVANMQPSTAIAQQINAALKDGKKLVISLETDKPSAPPAASVASVP
jgi:archaellum component FlaC